MHSGACFPHILFFFALREVYGEKSDLVIAWGGSYEPPNPLPSYRPGI